MRLLKEHIARVLALRSAGLSMLRIAEETDTTRGAVSGILHRARVRPSMPPRARHGRPKGGGGDNWERLLVEPWSEYTKRRQIEDEGWSLEHDDGHANGEIANAAASWASTGQNPVIWSWATDKASKPRRRQLVIAGALIVAEIERLDRSDAAKLLGGE